MLKNALPQVMSDGYFKPWACTYGIYHNDVTGVGFGRGRVDELETLSRDFLSGDARSFQARYQGFLFDLA